MLWNELIGHQSQLKRMRTAVAHGRLATTFLFIGTEGIGKRTFARLVAKSLLCRHSPFNTLTPCGRCEDCAQVDASTHPDLIEICKPDDKSEIPVKSFIGDPEHRMREGLCYDISLRPYGGRKKVAIIDDADNINEEGANALLKTLEEPPPDCLIILVGTSLQRQLPTIRSRCQSLLFQPLTVSQLTELIMRRQLASCREEAEEIARISGGSISEAARNSHGELREFRVWLFQQLDSPKIALSEVAKQCGQIVDAAGKEARLKRDRMKQLLLTAADFYRAVIFEKIKAEQAAHGRLESEHASRYLNGLAMVGSFSFSGAVECWQICLKAVDQVDRNANQTALLQAWIAELAQFSGR